MIPIGWLFDRYGAHKVSIWGASLTTAGLLLLEVPLLGVRYGYDAYTSSMLPFILFLTDVGLVVSGYAVMGLVYHFPGKMTFIMALTTTDTTTTPALLPNG